MNVLFILESKSMSCFYLLILNKSGKNLIRFGPDQLIASDQLGEAYKKFDGNIDGFCSWLTRALSGSIDHYVVLSESALCDFLFTQKETIEVRNPKEFMYYGKGGEDNQFFPKGSQSLNSTDFLRFISYQADAPGVYGIFNRQEHVLRLIKETLLVSYNPMSITKHFRYFIHSVETNLNLTDCLRLVGKYQEAKGQKIKRINSNKIIYNGNTKDVQYIFSDNYKKQE